jgi:hypothetical protein
MLLVLSSPPTYSSLYTPLFLFCYQLVSTHISSVFSPPVISLLAHSREFPPLFFIDSGTSPLLQSSSRLLSQHARKPLMRLRYATITSPPTTINCSSQSHTQRTSAMLSSCALLAAASLHSQQCHSVASTALTDLVLFFAMLLLLLKALEPSAHLQLQPSLMITLLSIFRLCCSCSRRCCVHCPRTRHLHCSYTCCLRCLCAFCASLPLLLSSPPLYPTAGGRLDCLRPPPELVMCCTFRGGKLPFHTH